MILEQPLEAFRSRCKHCTKPSIFLLIPKQVPNLPVNNNYKWYSPKAIRNTLIIKKAIAPTVNPPSLSAEIPSKGPKEKHHSLDLQIPQENCCSLDLVKLCIINTINTNANILHNFILSFNNKTMTRVEKCSKSCPKNTLKYYIN